MTDIKYCYREVFNANPHYYDYIHTFTLFSETEDDEHGKITMCAGGGQKIDFVAEGNYVVDFV